MRSTRTRLRAAITAGFALSAIGVLSLTSGTVAELTDSFTARADAGVAGVPYGIARTVSLGFDYTRTDQTRTLRERSATVDSRTQTRNNSPAETQLPFSYPSGIRLDRMTNHNGCASSNFNGNTNRCVDTQANSLVSASTGQNPTAGKYDIDFRDLNLDGSVASKAFLSVHDIRTYVSCHADGSVSAGSPSGNYWVGGQDGGSVRDSGWSQIPTENRYKRIRQWMRNLSGQNQAMTVEVQTIRQTFLNPPRAVSAVIVYATSSDSRDGSAIRGDFAFVSKSECAVSPDGSTTLEPSTLFGPLVPDVRRLDTPGWGGSFTSTLSEGPIAEPQQRSLASEQTPTVGAGALDVNDPLLMRPVPEKDGTASEVATSTQQVTTSTSTSTTTATPLSSTPGSRTTTTPTAKATQTTTSGGPSPTAGPSPTVANGYKTPDDQQYGPADGGSLTSTQRALVEQAIAGAATADSGDLPGGASYAVTADQLDGTTLIVTTASGGTLRIVWEK